jgi:hypothetical protein
VDLAQPRFVGPAYWTASERRLFLMINPGEGDGTSSDTAMRQDIRDYHDGKIGLEDVFRRQRGYMQTWSRGKFVTFIEKSGASLDEIALLNVAWCATKGNKYPAPMLQNCWEAQTQSALAALKPTIIVACGGHVQNFARRAGLSFVAAPHPAARFSIDFAAIKRTLGEIAREKTPIVLEAAVNALVQVVDSRVERSADRKSQLSDPDVIRLLRRDNPKTGLSKKRYDCYRDGMSVAEYRAEVARRLGSSEAAKCRADLRWVSDRHFIRIEPN